MISGAINFLKDFYSRNLFERLIIYGFLSGFFVKIVFELVLGQWSFVQSQNKQWVFYGLLSLDYIVSYRKIINMRVFMNPMSLFALVFFMMTAQGALIGILNHNPLFTYANDLVPLLMIAMNILRMHNAEESQKPVDFLYLSKFCILLAIGTCAAGALAVAIGNPSQPSVGNGAAYFPLVFAALFLLRPLPKWMLAAIILSFIATLDDFNRTTLIFCMLAALGYLGVRILKAPAQAILFLLIFVCLCMAAWATLPENSKTYRRIVGISEIDLNERTGSVGERQAEWDAIREKLIDKGQTVEWLGLGFGGTYEVQFTHQYARNYGHAHYAWAWFNLRFGKSGYIYMILMMVALAGNGLYAATRRSPLGLCVAYICLLGLVYCFTYVNSVFLLSGAHFFYVPSEKRRAPALNRQPEHT
jgi:hypothetical protein